MSNNPSPWECAHRWVCYSLRGKHQYDYCESCGFKVSPKLEVAIAHDKPAKQTKDKEITMNDYKVGDVLVKRGLPSSRIVQGTMGEIVFYVRDSGDRNSSFASTTELKKAGWKLKDPEETREMTVKEVEELVGQKVKIVKEK